MRERAIRVILAGAMLATLVWPCAPEYQGARGAPYYFYLFVHLRELVPSIASLLEMRAVLGMRWMVSGLFGWGLILPFLLSLPILVPLNGVLGIRPFRGLTLAYRVVLALVCCATWLQLAVIGFGLVESWARGGIPFLANFVLVSIAGLAEIVLVVYEKRGKREREGGGGR